MQTHLHATDDQDGEAGEGGKRVPSVGVIPVAVGVLGRRRESAVEVLIAHRPEDVVLGGHWEFPGGKLEPGESAEGALVRELAEELGVMARVVGALTTVEHAYAHGTVRLMVFGCVLEPVGGSDVPEAEPRALASQAVRWVGVDELREVSFPEANGPIVDAAAAWMAAGLPAL